MNEFAIVSQPYHHLGHLGASTIDLSVIGTEKIAMVVPENCEVQDVTLEVLEPADTGTTLSLGFKDEKAAIINGVDIATAGTKLRSDKGFFTPSKNEPLIVTLNQATQKGKVKIRVTLYFASVNVFEYPIQK